MMTDVQRIITTEKAANRIIDLLMANYNIVNLQTRTGLDGPKTRQVLNRMHEIIHEYEQQMSAL